MFSKSFVETTFLSFLRSEVHRTDFVDLDLRDVNDRPDPIDVANVDVDVEFIEEIGQFL